MKKSIQQLIGCFLVASSVITMSFTESTLLMVILATISLLSYTQLVAKPNTPES
jgi:hypothetical protein